MSGLLRNLVGAFARPRATLYVFVTMWAVGIVALTAVIGFQARVDNQLHAQVVVQTMQRQAGNLVQIALDPAIARTAGLPLLPNTFGLANGSRALEASLSTLSRLDSGSEQSRLEGLTGRYIAAIHTIAIIAARGPTRQAALAFGEAAQPTGTLGRLNAELHRATADYGRGATHARTVASIATIVAILFMLIAFSSTLYRVTRLARENQHLLDRSRVEALTDPLTGLANRRRFFADMDALLHESPPPDDLALGMFDLDGFKNYNDTFGHPAGDLLLARLGQRLAATVEGRGAAYRMGGDEFCVIARGANPEHILTAAESALSERGELFEISCSRGSVVIPHQEMTLEQALLRADQRLYDNKRLARASVAGHPPAALEDVA